MRKFWLAPLAGEFGFIMFGYWFRLRAPWCKTAIKFENGVYKNNFPVWKYLWGGWRYQYWNINE